MEPATDRDLSLLRRAARVATRGHGGVEPNPMVGCVITDPNGRVVAEGHHRRHGEAHAERRALEAAGERARGGTAYVTLEPCAHQGQTPPCADALIAAGIARVVYACADPHPVARGGAARLRSAGIAVEERTCAEAELVSEPFLKRVTTGLPWISAKWAQSLDGRIASRTGDSRWISCDRARRMVHRERGRVDAILTGYGTAMADDPQLTARRVRRRRLAMRVVVDPSLELPITLRLFDRAAPTVVICGPAMLDSPAARSLARHDVRTIASGARGELRPALEALRRDLDVSTVLVEAGGGLVGQLLREDLVDEAFVFVAPIFLGDAEAVAPARGLATLAIADVARWRLLGARRRGEDILIHVRRPTRA